MSSEQREPSVACPACLGAMPVEAMGQPLQAAHRTHAASPSVSVPEWAEGWSGGTCGCGAPAVTVIVQTGEQAVACARSGWSVDICKPMSCPCQCADPDCPDRPHAPTPNDHYMAQEADRG